MLKLGEIRELSGNYSQVMITRRKCARSWYYLMVFDKSRAGRLILADGKLASVRRCVEEYINECEKLEERRCLK